MYTNTNTNEKMSWQMVEKDKQGLGGSKQPEAVATVKSKEVTAIRPLLSGT